MNNPVIIKGNRYGIVLSLDDTMPFDELLIQIGIKFDDSNKYFNSQSQTAITFEGRNLSNDEIDQILTMIRTRTNLQIPYVIDNRQSTEEQFQRIIDANHPDTNGSIDSSNDTCTRYIYPDKNDGLFYKGTLRSGQSLEASGSLVIIGDVNPGATVQCNGNIIILGGLKGTAIAGADGRKSCFVLALQMSPMQVQIADIIGRAPDKPKKKLIQKQLDPQIAFVENDNIYIEPVSKAVLNDINI